MKDSQNIGKEATRVQKVTVKCCAISLLKKIGALEKGNINHVTDKVESSHCKLGFPCFQAAKARPGDGAALLTDGNLPEINHRQIF